MNKVIFFLSAVFFLSLTTACHKHDDDANNPVLTITSPTTGASISGAVSIKGSATDESLHELSIRVTKDSDNSTLFSSDPTVHDKTEYAISETWTPSGISSETAVTLTITVSDHSDHTVAQTVKFTVKP